MSVFPSALRNFGPDLALSRVLHPDHSSLADGRACTAPREGLALAAAPCRPLPGRRAGRLVARPSLDRIRCSMNHAVEYPPMRHANVPMRSFMLETALRLVAQIDGDGPLAERYIGARNRRPGPNAEIRPARSVHRVRHRLGVRHFPCVDRAAFPAVSPIGPNDRLKPFRRGFLRRKHLHHLTSVSRSDGLFRGLCWAFPVVPLYKRDMGSQEDDFK